MRWRLRLRLRLRPRLHLRLRRAASDLPTTRRPVASLVAPAVLAARSRRRPMLPQRRCYCCATQKKYYSWLELLPELRDDDTVIVRGTLQGPLTIKRARVTLQGPSAAESFTTLATL